MFSNISHGKEKRRDYLSLSPPDIPSFYTTFTYSHKLSLGPLKVRRPMTHSRVTVTVFQARALYGRWTSEYAHYGHRIHSRGDHTVSSSRYVSVFSWWHWRTLHLMRAPYFVDDTYGHCIWSESTIWSLDFKISSSRSPHTFCGANQPMVGWLGGQWFLEPTRVKVLVLTFIMG